MRFQKILFSGMIELSSVQIQQGYEMLRAKKINDTLCFYKL
jgi:hypothetical protein